MTQTALRRTPLYDIHRALGARLVPFAGWDMPVQYTSILDETRAVRTAAGLFDISHMGRARLHGPGALPVVQQVTTNDVAALKPGEAQYSLLTNPRGGIIDDLIVYCFGSDEFWLVLNAGNTEKDLDWIRGHSRPDVTIEDWTDQTAMIAVQGPTAVDLVGRLTDIAAAGVARFSMAQGKLLGHPAVFCRTGYTGEDGFELIVPAPDAADVWRALQAGGGVPCGLGARDVLRTEAGYPLYGHEIDDTTTPVEAGLMWVVKPDKGDFVGRTAILGAKRGAAGRKLVGVTLSERVVPRQGYTLDAEGVPVGSMTSGVFSPTRGIGLGMAYVSASHSRPGTALRVLVRSTAYPAVVVSRKDLLGR